VQFFKALCSGFSTEKEIHPLSREGFKKLVKPEFIMSELRGGPALEG
jgi:hypothetical protein